jgi:hypothetical protein
VLAEAAQDLDPIALNTCNQDLAFDMLRVVNSLIGPTPALLEKT